jgi:hypothetical protein
MSVHKKLMQVRVDLARQGLQRTGHNKFAGYKYFELSDFIPQAMELFLKYDLCGVVSYSPDEATLCITDVEDGTVIVIHSPMATAALKGAHDIQNLGAVESYQRRYLWMTALELTETDPIDSAEPLPIPKKDIPKPIVKTDKEVEKEEKASPEQRAIQDPFAIHIDTKNPELKNEDYIQILFDATQMQILNAHTQEDLMKIYQVNRKHYDKLNEIDARQHVTLLGMFKERKEALNGV